MIVFIEGPDNVGKGTQISNIYKELANRGEFPYWAHYANFGITDAEECKKYSEIAYRNMFAIAAANYYNGVTTIHDRAHHGEWVYGKIYRNYDAHFIWGLEQEMREEHIHPFANSHLITFTDDAENLVKRDDGLSFSIDLLHKQFELDRFEDAWEKSHFINKIIINIAGKDADQVWREVKYFLWAQK